MNEPLKVGIVGATGYTGSELIRILLNHPQVEVLAITSESKADADFAELHPQFQKIYSKKLVKSADLPDDLDLVFLGLPHGVSMDFVQKNHHKGYKIIDLSGDFRLPDAGVYEQWYGKKHEATSILKEFVFGLPELFREKVKSATMVANPGCYPTSALLGLAPLLKDKLILPAPIMVDSKSGVTGAGAKEKPATHYPNLFGNFYAYGLTSHRHTPEIQYYLQELHQEEVEVLFTPHLLPVDRGILSTIYAKPTGDLDQDTLLHSLATHYQNDYFVKVLDRPPQIKQVRGSNFCHLFATFDKRTNTAIIISAIDNLVKGASGQAVQNMNIMMGWPEKTGLEQLPLFP